MSSTTTSIVHTERLGWNHPIHPPVRRWSVRLGEPGCADATCLVECFTNTNELHETHLRTLRGLGAVGRAGPYGGGRRRTAVIALPLGYNALIVAGHLAGLEPDRWSSSAALSAQRAGPRGLTMTFRWALGAARRGSRPLVTTSRRQMRSVMSGSSCNAFRLMSETALTKSVL
jgi:hypothetical protein